MGYGVSRLKNVNPESIPARFRPILRCRIEEVQRRRRLESTKEELLDKAYDMDDSVAVDERYKELDVVEKMGGHDEAMVLDDDDTDDSSVVFPGSPSFRIYFVDNGDDDDNRALEIIKEEKKQSTVMDALEEKVQGFRPELKQCWPSVTTTPNDTFWSDQYNKHGICSQNILGLKKYFNNAITVVNDYKILNILTKGGILPSPSVSYTFTEIEAAVQITFPSIHIYVSCWFDTASKQLQLKEIYICFNKSVTRSISCPANSDQKNCRTLSGGVPKIYIP